MKKKSNEQIVIGLSKQSQCHCPKCGAHTEQEIAENITTPSYRRCSKCGWTGRPQWKIG